MKRTPRGFRLRISIFGRRNVGKSSLINALTGQPLAIVSATPGTTTDPVSKAMELLPFGPVTITDTAGLDDVGELGKLRIERTKKVLEKTDLAVLVVEGDKWDHWEEELIREFEKYEIPFVVAINKADLGFDQTIVENLKQKGLDVVVVSSLKGTGIKELKELLAKKAKTIQPGPPTIIGDLIKAGDFVLLVVPIDLGAPKGRLILPQVQVIRDALDHDATAIVVKERELLATLRELGKKPALVITDSQVVLKVVGDVPKDIPMTTFSILFARLKGDLEEFVRGVKTIDRLQDGDRVLIAEACTHHPLPDDIGRVKIPRWIRQYTGKDIKFDVAAGINFPDNVEDYKLIVHCGGCTITRREMLVRMRKAKELGIPITNYGVTISYVHGVLERALSPFPYLQFVLRSAS